MEDAGPHPGDLAFDQFPGRFSLGDLEARVEFFDAGRGGVEVCVGEDGVDDVAS